MALTPDELQAWKDRHAAVSARMLEVHNRCGGERPFEPKAAAAYDRDYMTAVRDFEQFKDMPDEVWDEILPDDDSDAVA